MSATTRPCPACDGVGCSQCNDTGVVPLDPDDTHQQSEFNIKLALIRQDQLEVKIDDLTDKVNDVMDKCNDIFEAVTEP